MRRWSTYRPKGQFNVILLGNSTVGKTSLLLRFVSGNVPPISEPIPTIGVECTVKRICLPNGIVRLKIVDTAGQKRFKNLLRPYLHSCHGAAVVYDIQDRKSFVEAQEWVDELREKFPPELVIFLVGNKVDMEILREVTNSEAAEYAFSNNLIFMETSSMSGFNVNNCFMELAHAIYDQKKAHEESCKCNRKDNEEIKPGCCCIFKNKEIPSVQEKHISGAHCSY